MKIVTVLLSFLLIIGLVGGCDNGAPLSNLLYVPLIFIVDGILLRSKLDEDNERR